MFFSLASLNPLPLIYVSCQFLIPLITVPINWIYQKRTIARSRNLLWWVLMAIRIRIYPQHTLNSVQGRRFGPFQSVAWPRPLEMTNAKCTIFETMASYKIRFLNEGNLHSSIVVRSNQGSFQGKQIMLWLTLQAQCMAPEQLLASADSTKWISIFQSIFFVFNIFSSNSSRRRYGLC